MLFCGQCGFQLAPGTTRCPRCGAAVDATNEGRAGELHNDDATIASPSFTPQHSSQLGVQQPLTPGEQQQLVLRPESSADYGAQTAYGPTSHVDAQTNYPTNRPSYPGYGPPGNQDYYTSNVPGSYMTPGGGNYQIQQPFYPGYGPVEQPYQYDQAARNRGRTTGLVLILLGLLLILSAVILYVLQHNGAFGGTSSIDSPQALVQQYYSDIDAREYNGAYSLWKNPPGSLNQLKQGYQNTLSNQVIINNVSPQ